MTTAVMPARSRSSLRVLRKDPNGNDNEGENSVEPPPPKRPRLMNPAHPTTRRRKSSPDLLDTTIDSTPSLSPAAVAASASSKLRRPRPSLFALSARTGTGGSGTTSSPPPGLGLGGGASPVRTRNTPNSLSTAFYLDHGRESPDPLDTISPAPAPPPPPPPVAKAAPKPKPKPQPKPSTTATATPTPTAYRQRRLTHYLKPESESDKEKTEHSKPKPKPGAESPSVSTSTSTSSGAGARSARTAPPRPGPEDQSQQSLPVPVETASRGQEKRRSLRSHDGGSRTKSELAQYFPNFDQLISLEPVKTELFSGTTVIKLIDDLSDPLSITLSSGADAPFGNPLVNLHNCETITLPNLADTKEEEKDPLNNEHYFKAHRRHERQEKQLRNIERDRAQHEKQTLDRLLDELKSQEWLRVLGITPPGRSLSEQEKKQYEPKRDYFIAEISAVLQKFQIWKEEEKRRKTDKDKAASFGSDTSFHAKDKDNGIKDEDARSSSQDQDDVDALAARQLLQEARSATAGKKTKSKADPADHHQHQQQPPPPPLDPLKPFTSFFSKPHLRAQAMSRDKNTKNRTRLAFGHPVPEVKEKEFALPDDILTPEAIKDCQRKRRRMKRERASLT